MQSGQNAALAAVGQGMAEHQAGRLDAADRHYRRALEADPNQFDALHFLGLLHAQRGDLIEADRLVERSLAVDGRRAEAHFNHARILRQLDRFADALVRCDKALAIDPGMTDALVMRGNALRDLGRLDEALASLDRALQLRPGDAVALYARGVLLLLLWRLDEALASFDRSLSLRPGDADTFVGRGHVLTQMYRQREALAAFDGALAARPNDPEILVHRGDLLHLMNRWEQALESYANAERSKPGLAKARLGACMAELPVLYRTDVEVTAQRAAYERRLRALQADVARGGFEDLADLAGTYQPFFLAYQGMNDRDLQTIYGETVCRAVAKRYPPLPAPAPPSTGERVRVGIVTGYFWRHSVWKIPVKGWVEQLDRRRFEVIGYYVGTMRDDETRAAAQRCDRFVQGPMSVARWRETIAADAPHVLLYPDIGMDAMSAALAAQRLAPVQCMSLGHPDTSGFPTVDYFLSSDLMEPADAEAHYTEKLVRLPNIGVYYDPLETRLPSVTCAELEIRSDAVVFWCGQSLFKYLPKHDDVFPRIARAISNSQFVFIDHPKGPAATDDFRKRLERAFQAFGLRSADHCVILPRRDQHAFVAAIGCCDIVLDSIGWSGFNSTIEGLVHDLPVVTLKGPLMRGAHTAAVLAMMGMQDTIAGSVDGYVDIAVRLANDAAWRAEVKARMAANRNRIYRDRSCIVALETFLERVARPS